MAVKMDMVVTLEILHRFVEIKKLNLLFIFCHYGHAFMQVTMINKCLKIKKSKKVLITIGLDTVFIWVYKLLKNLQTVHLFCKSASKTS